MDEFLNHIDPHVHTHYSKGGQKKKFIVLFKGNNNEF